MKLFNKTLINAIWKITKKNYPEWDAPVTPKDGITKEEKKEIVDYQEKDNEKK